MPGLEPALLADRQAGKQDNAVVSLLNTIDNALLSLRNFMQNKQSWYCHWCYYSSTSASTRAGTGTGTGTCSSASLELSQLFSDFLECSQTLS